MSYSGENLLGKKAGTQMLASAGQRRSSVWDSKPVFAFSFNLINLLSGGKVAALRCICGFVALCTTSSTGSCGGPQWGLSLLVVMLRAYKAVHTVLSSDKGCVILIAQ